MSKVMIDICHPADVHFFRHIITHLTDKGHEVLVLSRPKDVSLQLLDEFGVEFEVRGTHYSSLLGKAYGLLRRNRLVRLNIKEFKPDLIMGFASPYAAQMAWYSRVPCITFNDTERAFLGNTTTHPFTKYLVCPEFSNIRSRKRGLRFKGIFEQLYLSNRFFKPDPTIKSQLGLKQDQHYLVIRMVAWNAAHDTYPHYLNVEGTLRIISKLSEYARVFISSEIPVPPEFEEYFLPTKPSEFHHVIASASLCLSEGAKTASEAAILGVPCILMNNVSLGVPRTLERIRLLDIEPHPEKAMEIAHDYLEQLDNNEKREERERTRDQFWIDTVDVPSTILDFVDDILQKV